MQNVIDELRNIAQRVPVGRILFYILCVEIVSFAGYEFPLVNTTGFFILLLLAAILSIRRLQDGLLLLFIELVLGSKGYLFFYTIGDFPISLRLGLFVVVWLAYLVWIIRDRRIAFFSWKLWKPYTAFFLVIGFAVLWGIVRGNTPSTVFFDMNGYLYLTLIAPLTQSIRQRADVERLLAAVGVATVALMIKTLFLLFLWSHLSLFEYMLPDIYRWIRTSGVGEITRFPSGFSRIFFQSHLYVLIIFFCLLPWYISSKKSLSVLTQQWGRRFFFLLACSMLVIFLSYSRSFWVAVAATGLIALIWFLWKEKIPFSRLLLSGVLLFTIAAADYGIALGIVNFPLPGSVRVDSGALLSERTKNVSDEPAAATRWQSLRPLVDASLQHSFIGSGLGTTVTYESKDPRVLQDHPDGKYTTYAFEWGYLDLWLKFGIIGITVYAWIFFTVFREGLRQYARHKERLIILGSLFALISILATHVFTPYINHPLGIGWILLTSLLVTTPYLSSHER